MREAEVAQADRTAPAAIGHGDDEVVQDKSRELQEALQKTFIAAASHDTKYIRNIEKYRKRVSEMNLISKQELAKKN